MSNIFCTCNKWIKWCNRDPAMTLAVTALRAAAGPDSLKKLALSKRFNDHCTRRRSRQYQRPKAFVFKASTPIELRTWEFRGIYWNPSGQGNTRTMNFPDNIVFRTTSVTILNIHIITRLPHRKEHTRRNSEEFKISQEWRFIKRF